MKYKMEGCSQILPGSRDLAKDTGVNRKTVVLAYEELIVQGWLNTIPKKGTFVTDTLPKPKWQNKSTTAWKI